jgi:hypothetical protein
MVGSPADFESLSTGHRSYKAAARISGYKGAQQGSMHGPLYVIWMIGAC